MNFLNSTDIRLAKKLNTGGAVFLIPIVAASVLTILLSSINVLSRDIGTAAQLICWLSFTIGYALKSVEARILSNICDKASNQR